MKDLFILGLLSTVFLKKPPPNENGMLNRWEQKTGRATGNKEDAKTLNFFLYSLEMKIRKFAEQLVEKQESLNSVKLINFILG